MEHQTRETRAIITIICMQTVLALIISQGKYYETRQRYQFNSIEIEIEIGLRPKLTIFSSRHFEG